MGALRSSGNLVPAAERVFAALLEAYTDRTHSLFIYGTLEDSLGPLCQQKYESGLYSVMAGPEGTGLHLFRERANLHQEKAHGEEGHPQKSRKMMAVDCRL